MISMKPIVDFANKKTIVTLPIILGFSIIMMPMKTIVHCDLSVNTMMKVIFGCK